MLICSKLSQLVAEELHGAGEACEAATVEHSDKARRPAKKGNHQYQGSRRHLHHYVQ